MVQILRYIKGEPRKRLKCTSKDHTNVVGYSGGNWAGDVSDRMSTSSHCVLIGENLSHGKVRRKMLLQRHVLKHSIVLWPTQLGNLYGQNT